MKSIHVILVLVVTFLSSCGAPAEEIARTMVAVTSEFQSKVALAVHETKAAHEALTPLSTSTPLPPQTPYATNTPLSTHTPFPTQNPLPTITPLPTNTEVVPSRTPTPMPTTTSSPTSSSTPVPTNTPAPVITVPDVIQVTLYTPPGCSPKPRSSCSGAVWPGAQLQGKDLDWSDFSYADLRGANLEGANLNGVNFTGANLSYANLRNASFRNLATTGLNLSYADVTGTGTNYWQPAHEVILLETIHDDCAPGWRASCDFFIKSHQAANTERPIIPTWIPSIPTITPTSENSLVVHFYLDKTSISFGNYVTVNWSIENATDAVVIHYNGVRHAERQASRTEWPDNAVEIFRLTVEDGPTSITKTLKVSTANAPFITWQRH